MLRRARTDDVLGLSTQDFNSWLQINDVTLHEVRPGQVPSKGAALVATRDVQNSDSGAECLLTVPRELILGLDRVKEHAKIDRGLREVLEAAGEIGQTARGAILIFLLTQLSIVCASDNGSVGVRSPFVEYFKSLPAESLPTTWTSDELSLLIGTTLAPATAHKMRSLQREYDLLCSNASSTRWYQHVESLLSFDDWVQVDAMYRSRALDYPGIGHCMVPCLDLANHQSGDGTAAIYELDAEGNAILLLRHGKVLAEGDEVTISYGDEKGACEMLFSYGFLEPTMPSGEALFLNLAPQNDDMFAIEKQRIAACAPGVKLVNALDGDIDWHGDFIWLLCVNIEDGLRFQVARLTDGTEEVQAFFGDHELTGGAAELRQLLAKTNMWEVYRLRAIAILQQRVFDQLEVLHGTQEDVEARTHVDCTDISRDRYRLALSLRTLEFDLLNSAYEDFERQKIELAKSEAVQAYLAAVNAGNSHDQVDDFT